MPKKPKDKDEDLLKMRLELEGVQAELQKRDAYIAHLEEELTATKNLLINIQSRFLSALLGEAQDHGQDHGHGHTH